MSLGALLVAISTCELHSVETLGDFYLDASFVDEDILWSGRESTPGSF